jgi:hypothetical protein
MSFCQWCGENAFKSSEVWSIEDDEHPRIKCNLVCDTPTKKCKSYIGERRCIPLEFSGYDPTLCRTVSGALELNVNLIDKDNRNWTPATLGISDADKSAAKANVLRARIPTHQRWQFIVKAKPDMPLETDLYYKFGKIETKDGRVVKIKNQSGRTDFYIPIIPFSQYSNRDPSMTEVCGYETGVEGEQFFFIAPPKAEVESGLADESNNLSNIFQGTITIHKKVMRKTIVARGSVNDDVQYRGASKGGTTRGGSFTGGTNLGTSGFQGNVQTRQVDADFPEIDSIKFTIQIVNDETDAERIYFANIIEKQTQIWRDSKIESLISQRNIIDDEIATLRTGTVRSRGMEKVSSSFREQEVHLI